MIISRQAADIRQSSATNTALLSAFVRIPGGSFLMGSATGQEDELPVHEVEVDDFEMAICPVTNREYTRFLEWTGYTAPASSSGGTSPADEVRRRPEFADPDQPVVAASWYEAVAYCAWLSAELGVEVRLPTEAEWERAARGGVDGEAFPWGDAIPAWIPNKGRGPLAAPWPVSLGEANRFGIYGIAANVHEWCADWHSRDYYARSPRRNPAGPAEGIRRASRGGSWRHRFTISRSSARSKLDPSFRYTDYGFRIVRGGARRPRGDSSSRTGDL